MYFRYSYIIILFFMILLSRNYYIYSKSKQQIHKVGKQQQILYIFGKIVSNHQNKSLETLRDFPFHHKFSIGNTTITVQIHITQTFHDFFIFIRHKAHLGNDLQNEICFITFIESTQGKLLPKIWHMVLGFIILCQIFATQIILQKRSTEPLKIPQKIAKIYVKKS